MAHIRESHILATHPIHTKTQQVLHLLLESAKAHEHTQNIARNVLQKIK